VSQLVGPVQVPPNGSTVNLVLSETDPVNGQYEATIGEYPAWNDPTFAGIWAAYGP
jgi:hypothetical protein